ncbi:proton-coupled folate transporter-like [Leguminivora glycinivorella]|uniref:proton-coupled folate transporter-like n=1 Tax=Leguminivora glycinivorella TaxID=1035111 RepID=UPI00200F96D9|nr:proton-coupled folate transporter-like [Leguminivora glycinivorella]
MDSSEEAPLKANSSSANQKQRKTLKEKIKYVKDNITVEPVVACFVVPGVLARLATQNLNLDKACRVNLGYGDVVCDSLLARDSNKYLRQELAVQELVASMEVWKTFIVTAIPSFLILFLGAWSDRTRKRKICILLPVIGDLLMCLSNILSVYFFYEIPVQWTMFLEAIFPAITGGWITSYMGIFSYISDISSVETRTFRIGVTNLCTTAGGPIASALSGVLLHNIGYYGVFAVSGLLFLFSICYGFVFIQDPEQPVSEKEIEDKSGGVCGSLKSFFNTKHVKDTLAVAFKKGPNHRQAKSILILTCILLIHGPWYGEHSVRYLFTRYRFNWDALKYSFYNTFYILVHIVGALISISLFSRYLKWDDSVLGIISTCSKFVGAIAVALATTSLDMYIAVLLETFNATTFTAMRSITSKLVTSDELGKMTSVFNLTEVLANMMFGPVYSWLYRETLSIEPGVVYYVSAAITVIPIIIFVWLFTQRKKNDNTEINNKIVNADVDPCLELQN